MSALDRDLMRRALDLAARGRYSVSPNPMVGCLVVRDGVVIGEGFHRRAGQPHAEVEALRDCRTDPAGATVYVSLEPCSHHGRTPPCTRALIGAGVRRVVVATGDPDPRVQGRGLEELRAAGIEVETGVLEADALRLNEIYFHSVRSALPFVILKAGMSLDSKLAMVDPAHTWITGEPARERSLALREEVDAILVGAGTIIADDPRLTRRLGWNESILPWTRVVLDVRGKIPRSSGVLTDGASTILFTASPDAYGDSDAVEIVPMQAEDGKLSISDVLSRLHARGTRSVLVEGGGAIHTAMIRSGLWQKMILFVAPMVIGGAHTPSLFEHRGLAELTEAIRFRFDAVERVGDDLMLTLLNEPMK